jgi:hypothetical protein
MIFARASATEHEPGSGPLSRTQLTVLTVNPGVKRYPDYSASCSAFTTEGNVDAERPKKRLRPTQVAGEGAGIFGPADAVVCVTGPFAAGRRRSAALPVQELRSLMNSRTRAATGSASMVPSIAALRLAV